ncbi:EutN/CcmL family microcompartment protein [Pseudonocardia adelaidensis]|uniref:Ethanolamine utilization protein EutN n=1 Tax=Pseudonocardia adelaidensis TaxID=648754 RepID=A0ABP9PCR8_9PSEU
MMLGTVVRRVWSDRQLHSFDGRRLVLVAEAGSDRREVAVDLVDAGPGVLVLVATDEAAAAAAGDASIDAAVVALVSDPPAEEGLSQ